MNEEFLRSIYDSKNLGANGATFEDFLKDMQDINFARKIFDSKELGSQGATFDDFITDAGLKPPSPAQEQGGFYNFLGKVPGVGKALQATVDAWERGINKGKDVDEGINAMIGGLSPEEGDAVLGILQRNKASIEKDKSITKKFTDDEEWSLGAAAGAWAEGVVESTAMMTRGLLDAFTDWKTASYITGRAAAGAALFGAKSAAATAATGPGAAVGGGIGATIGTISMAMGANSGLIEASQFYFQELQKELDTRGLSLTKANIFSIANDAEWLSKTRKDAATKGLIIDAFDTAAGVFGAKFGGSTAKLLVDQGLKARAKDFVKTGVKGAAIDAAFGAGGEYVSGQAIGQPTSAKELFLEANPIGPGIITGPLSLLKDNTSIVAAKKARTAAEKTNTPITAEIKENSEKMTGVPGLIDAYKSDDIEQAKTALADLATVHTPEEFSGMLEVQGRIEGLSAEEIQAINGRFVQTYEAAQKFNTPELQQDPERTSRAVKTRLDITQAETAETQLEEQKAAADPSLHPKYDEQIQAVREVKADLEETLGAIVAAPKLEVSDDIGFYRTRLDELETTKTTTKNESSAKTQELLELGAVLQDTISSAISEEYGETVVETPAAVQKVLYDGVEYEVTRVNKDGSFDLSSRDGKFVKAAEKTDAEWQGFVGEPAEATTTPPLPPVKKEKKSSAVTRLEKAAAAIKGSPIAQIESIGALLNIASIPDFIYAKIGDGDISAGKAVVQKAKDLHGEVKAFQSKLAGGKFFSDLDRQIAETRSRIETLEKQPTTRQIPATETPSATAETPAIRQEPVIGETETDTVNEPVSDTESDAVNEGVSDGVNVSPANSVDGKTKQQLLDERLNKIKEIKDRAEGTRDERTKRYVELVNELGDETAALRALQKEIDSRAKQEIDKLPDLPKTENEVINEKGENDFEKIKKDLGFKPNNYTWGGRPIDNEMGDMLLNKEKDAVIFIKPNEVEVYDEENDSTDTITNGIKIELISTKDASRGKGKAKELIQRVIDWADKNGTTLFLDIAPQDNKTTESGLKKLYEAFGFEFEGIYGKRDPKSSPANLAEETLPQETQKKLEDLAKEVTMKASTASDLYLINRRIWGLNHEQAIETAVIQDRLVAEMARRAGISKTEMYKSLPFTKNPTSIPGNALYQIIGESAKLTRQVLTNLGLAQRQEKLGRTSSFIHNLTGWERGADGRWRYKINFGKLTLTLESLAAMPKNLDGNPVTTLGEIYDAPELFTAYPQLREVEVVFDKKTPPGNGGYDGSIRLSYDQVAKEYRGTSLMSVLVHEIQHVVQDIEGFAQGGNPSMFDESEVHRSYRGSVLDGISKNERLNQAYRSLNNARNNLMEYLIFNVNNAVADDSLITPILDDIDKRYNTAIYGGDFADFNDYLMSDVYDFLAERGVKDTDKLTDTIVKEFDKFEAALQELRDSTLLSEIHDEAYDKISTSPKNKQDFYRRLSGEVEARAAQKMLGLSPEEIRNARLIDLYDVHPDYQIIQFGSDYSSLSSVLPPNNERQQIEAQAKKDGTWMKAPNGKPTNLTEQQWVTVRTKAFKSWFGDFENDPKNASKVVDSNGEPLVVYHGTNAKFNEFETDIVYTTSNKKHAEEYGKNIIPLFANVRNLYLTEEDEVIRDENGRKFKDSDKEDITVGYLDANDNVVNDLIKRGFDGASDTNFDFIASFNPDQIKLADGTNTTFDPNTGDIRFQKDPGLPARGAMAIQSDGIAVMYALTNPNVSTPVHELVHVFERYLTDAEKQTVLAEFGGNEWTTETSEFFARGFERYLLDGVAPTPELQTTFEKFKKWLTDIYLGIRNSVIDTPISVAMENLYASFLTDEQLNNAVNQPPAVINHRQIEELRDLYDLDALKKTAVPVDASIKDALQNHVSRPEDNYAKELALALDAMNGLALDAPRQLAIAYAIKRLKADRSTAEQQLKLAQKKYWGLGGDIGSHRAVLDAINEDIDMLTRGLYRAGSVLGRSLAVRKEILESSRWEAAAVEEQLKDMLKDVVSTEDFKKGVINEQDRETIRKLTDRVNQIKTEVDELLVKEDKSATTAKQIIAQQEIKKPRGKSISKKISAKRSLKSAKAQLDNVLAGKIC